MALRSLYVSALLLLLAAVRPAHADWTASSSLTNFRFELNDLDPADGTTPALYLQSSSNSLSATLRSDDDNFRVSQTTQLFPTPPKTFQYEGSGSVFAQALQEPFGSILRASGGYDAINTHMNDEALGRYSSYVIFSLAPRTSLTLRADALSSLVRTAYTPDMLITDTNIMITLGSFDLHQNDQDWLQLDAAGMQPDLSAAKQLELTLANNTDVLASAYFSISHNVSVRAIPAVPEVSQALMLSFGAAMLLLLRRGERFAAGRVL